MPKGIYKRNPEKLAKVKLLMEKFHSGMDSFHWKGNNVKYAGLHRWVSKWLGKPELCSVCGDENAKRYEWANVDHKYRRILEDYIRMCTRCHREYDRDVLKIKVGRFSKGENQKISNNKKKLIKE